VFATSYHEHKAPEIHGEAGFSQGIRETRVRGNDEKDSGCSDVKGWIPGPEWSGMFKAGALCRGHGCCCQSGWGIQTNLKWRRWTDGNRTNLQGYVVDPPENP